MQMVSRQTLKRLPLYLQYLQSRPPEASPTISATAIAQALRLGQVQVRKDLACVSSSGRPKRGYLAKELENELIRFLGYDNVDNAVVVGAGRLGRALLGFEGFETYGLCLLGGFDRDPETIGQEENGKPIFPMEKLADICGRLNVHIAVLTVPAEQAQEVTDQLVACGIRAVWNFTPVWLKAPSDVLIQNENLAVSLARLSQKLAKTYHVRRNDDRRERTAVLG